VEKEPPLGSGQLRRGCLARWPRAGARYAGPYRPGAAVQPGGVAPVRRAGQAPVSVRSG